MAGLNGLAAVGIMLLVLAACDQSPSHRSDTVTTRKPSLATPAASISPKAVSQALRRCKASELRVHAGRESDGTRFAASADIEIVNRGHVPCRLSGVPTVSIIRQPATRLPVRYAVPREVDIQSVMLRAQAGHRALIHLVWLNWCGGRPGPLMVAVHLPHMRGRLVGSFDGPPAYDFVPSCLSATRASTLTLFTAYRH